MKFLAIIILLMSPCIFAAEESNFHWRADEKLHQSTDEALVSGEIDIAVLKVISWCTTKYQKESESENLDKKKVNQLTSDIQEASLVLSFVVTNKEELQRLDTGNQTYGVFLAYFDVLFNQYPHYNGSGKSYLEFIETYSKSRKYLDELIKTKLQNKTLHRITDDTGEFKRYFYISL
jgi:hypothetical protein